MYLECPEFLLYFSCYYSFTQNTQTKTFSTSYNNNIMSQSVEIRDSDYTAAANDEVISKEIRDAYKEQDAVKSRKLHESKIKKHSDSASAESEIIFEVPSQEQHKSLGEYVKSIIYGGLDGIITTFAIVAGIAGADLSTEVILVLGFGMLLLYEIQLQMYRVCNIYNI